MIWVCKGFESGTSQFPHQIAEEILPASFPRGVLSGPSFAQEVARSQPTAMTLASNDGEFAQRTAKALHHSRLRIYSSTDMVGVEIGGAVKNVLAIAAGICDGMKMGLNARAALLTRGLAEMTRLGLQMGGRAETLGGLSGVGDLILTCTGDLSRNRQVGMLLAQHKSLDNILSELGHVAEGVYTAREVHRIAQQHGVEMPICEAVYRVLYENLPADKAVEALLSRQPGNEFDRTDCPAYPHCRHASNTTTATVFDRFKLRLSGSIGRRKRRSGGIDSSTSSGRPRLSGPNRKASPA